MYAVIGEANGQALPLAFLFVRSTGEKSDGAKIDLLENFLLQLRERGVLATDSAERAEIVAFARVFHTKRQLCYWHGIKYLKERLAENKPPAYYDSRVAHFAFGFIDPEWAPGLAGGRFVPGSFEEEETDEMGELIQVCDDYGTAEHE